MVDLAKLCKQIAVESILHSNSDEYRILILDGHTVGILSQFIRPSDLVEQNIVLIEKLELHRPQAGYSGLYFLSATNEAIGRLILDFSAPKSKPPQYKDAYVIINGFLSAPQLEMLGRSCAMSYIKEFKEIHLNFYTRDPFLYCLNLGSDSHFGYRKKKHLSAHIDAIASKLVGFLVTLGELPEFRVRGKTGHSIPEQLVERIKKELDERLVRGDICFKQKASTRPVFLVLDRLDDVITPLMHEFTYQAMMHDVLGDQIKGGNKFVYKTDTGEEKALVLEDSDEIWKKTKYLHIADAINEIVEDFTKFKSDNKAAKKSTEDGGDDKSHAVHLSDLKAALLDLPKYHQMKDAFAAHINSTHTCMDAFKKGCLEQVAMLEQSMVAARTKKDAEQPDTTPALSNPNISNIDKARLCILACILRGKKPKEYLAEKRISRANLPSEYIRAIKNVAHIQYDLWMHTKYGTESRNTGTSLKSKNAKHGLSRYVPPLENLIRCFNRNDFDAVLDTKPILDAAASMYVQKVDAPKAVSLRRPAKQSQHKQHLIIFVHGGLAWSEVRAVHDLVAKNTLNTDVIIGCSSMLTSESFIHDLASIK